LHVVVGVVVDVDVEADAYARMKREDVFFEIQ
jgi:hypothetical protein